MINESTAALCIVFQYISPFFSEKNWTLEVLEIENHKIHWEVLPQMERLWSQHQQCFPWLERGERLLRRDSCLCWSTGWSTQGDPGCLLPLLQESFEESSTQSSSDLHERCQFLRYGSSAELYLSWGGQRGWRRPSKLPFGCWRVGAERIVPWKELLWGQLQPSTSALFPNGSPFGDPGPHGDLFGDLGPHWVPILCFGSPFPSILD